MNTNKRGLTFFTLGVAVVAAFFAGGVFFTQASSNRPLKSENYFQGAIDERDKAAGELHSAGCVQFYPKKICHDPKYLDLGNVWIRSNEVLLKSFNKLIVYYERFNYQMQPDEVSNFPDIMRFENFNNLLVETIKDDFAHCMNHHVIGDQIVILRPDEHNASHVTDEMTDPENLTILISVDYGVYPRNDKQEQPSKYDVYGRAMFNLYRPRLPDKVAIETIAENRGMIQFPKTLGENFEPELKKFFKSMVPWRCRSYQPGYISPY